MEEAPASAVRLDAGRRLSSGARCRTQSSRACSSCTTRGLASSSRT